jgi:UDP-N-acetylmuramoyl-L-alanyl-D-glutamate--2,6-diaminopimelate ligase
VLVDYAHTPDALINVGKALRDLMQTTGGKLITVFGCGGDRDRNKRPLMAQAAQRYADVVVLTSDNPRTEDPQQILNDAEQGFIQDDDNNNDNDHAVAERSEASDTETHTIPDRAEAIRFAINLATEHDTVVIAGKGHEDYQIVGTTKHHFDDREQAAAALREKACDA